MTDIQRIPSLPTPRQPRPARGFTLLEILVVVGILAVLITLAAVGFKVVGGAGRGKVSNVALENAKGLLAEYETSGTLTTLIDAATIADMHKTPTFRWLG